MTGKGRVMGGKGNNAHLSISTQLLAGIVEKAAETFSSPVLWTGSLRGLEVSVGEKHFAINPLLHKEARKGKTGKDVQELDTFC